MKIKNQRGVDVQTGMHIGHLFAVLDHGLRQITGPVIFFLKILDTVPHARYIKPRCPEKYLTIQLELMLAIISQVPIPFSSVVVGLWC